MREEKGEAAVVMVVVDFVPKVVEMEVVVLVDIVTEVVVVVDVW